MFKSLWKKIRGKKKKGLFRGEITWREVTVVLVGLALSTFVWEFMRIYQEKAAEQSAIVLKVCIEFIKEKDQNIDIYSIHNHIHSTHC